MLCVCVFVCILAVFLGIIIIIINEIAMLIYVHCVVTILLELLGYFGEFIELLS